MAVIIKYYKSFAVFCQVQIMNFQNIKNAYAQNIIMKTYEWMIKIISYILCCAAVCAGFSLKERGAENALQGYIKSEEEQKTSRLCGILIR